MSRALGPLITRFTDQLLVVIEAATEQRVSEMLASLYGEGVYVPGRRGRPGKLRVPRALARAKAPKGARPKQLCPVPGCENVAAPAFGMVCAEHKEIPRAVIAKYRAERRGDFSHLTAEAEAAPAKNESTEPSSESDSASEPAPSP
jgi:hypothetical protein